MLLDISISKPKDKPSALTQGQVRVVRRFEGGLVEIEDKMGRRRRVWETKCVDCRNPLLLIQSTFGDPICNGCSDERQRQRLQKRKDQLNSDATKRRMLELEMGLTAPQRRQTALLLASPDWRDRKAIKAVYAEARKKTKETGITHHVDHIYPIQCSIACGLHVHWNLQVMVGSENCSKSNEFPLEDSPAWDGYSIEEINREIRGMVMWFKQSGIDTGGKSPHFGHARKNCE